MCKNKFYKNLFQSLSCFASIMVLVFALLIGFFESLHDGKNFGFILLIIALSLIALFFLIGFYWLFQKVIIDEKGIKIIFINKVLKKYKWEEVEIIEEANIMRNPALRIKLVNGLEIHLDKRKSIIKAIKKYSQKDIVIPEFFK